MSRDRTPAGQFVIAVFLILSGVVIGVAVGSTGPVSQRIAGWKAKVAERRALAGQWATVARIASTLSPPSGPLQVVEAVDYECPYCRATYDTVEAFIREHPRSAIGFIQLPLENVHPHARRGALFALCAEEQGRFAQAQAYLFGSRDWLAATPSQVATRLGVAAIDSFEVCLGSERTAQRLASQRKALEHLRVDVTPTLLSAKTIRRGVFRLEDLIELTR